MTAESISGTLDYYERQIDRYWNGGSDPRGPVAPPPWNGPDWPTRPLWELARTVARIGRLAEAERCAQIIADLGGRCRSPEELVAFTDYVAPPPVRKDER